MTGVIHFEIPTRDPKKAIDFYSDVFDWEIKKWGTADYWMISTGTINGAIIQKASDGVVEEPLDIIDAAHAVNTVITVEVPNITDTIARIQENGGKIVMDRWPVGGVGMMAYFSDLDGNVMGVMETEKTEE